MELCVSAGLYLFSNALPRAHEGFLVMEVVTSWRKIMSNVSPLS